MADAPTLDRTGSTFRLSWSDLGITATVRGISSRDAFVRGEVTWSLSDSGHLHQGLLTLNDGASKHRCAVALSDRWPLDWSDLVEQLGVMVLAAWRSGEPVVPLRPSCPEESAPVPAVIEPWVVEGLPAVIFGDPGSGKSLLALFLATLAATGEAVPGLPLRPLRPMRPLVLDWESTRQDQTSRLARICRGLGITEPDGLIRYRRCTSPLALDVESVSDAILATGTDLLIVDSLGPAAGGDLSSSTSAESFYSALRSLNCTALCVAHTAKNSDPKHRSIFGSVFFSAHARNIVEVKRFASDAPNVLNLGLFHRKSNTGPLASPLGLALTFTPDVLTVTGEDAGTMPGLADGLPLPARVTDLLLSEGALMPRGIADALGVSYNVATATLSRLRERGGVLRLEDGRYAVPTTEDVCPF